MYLYSINNNVFACYLELGDRERPCEAEASQSDREDRQRSSL